MAALAIFSCRQIVKRDAIRAQQREEVQRLQEQLTTLQEQIRTTQEQIKNTAEARKRLATPAPVASPGVGPNKSAGAPPAAP
jgi:uncharacterized protein YlxW (UPF0749 family)